MSLLDLKHADSDQIILNRGISPIEFLRVRRELPFYDEYYMTSSGKVIKIFRQEFVKDPYMDLPPMDEIRLMDYQSGTSLDDLVEVAAMADCPVITRVQEGDSIPGFSPISNQRHTPARLIPVRFPELKQFKCRVPQYVGETRVGDLNTILEWFRMEYSLRYRMIELLFLEDPRWCHLFEKDGVMMGAMFSKMERSCLYLRQIFIPKIFRGRGVGDTLYNYQFELASSVGIDQARGNSREETYRFQKRMGGKLDDRLPANMYVVKR